jgi:glutamate 5-kinase
MYKRIVVKVGSSILTENFTIAQERLDNLVAFLARLQKQSEVILVSSGAVAAGNTELDIDKSTLANKQALAAIGQPLLMKKYKLAFDHHNVTVSQLLMTAANFDSRRQTTNAKAVVDTLLQNKVIPIINENDTIATEELVFGDNDQLSAYVTNHFDADLLIILSDIEGYYDKNPSLHSDAKIKKVVSSISDEEIEAEHTPNNHFATGGIVTKLQAAAYILQNSKEMFLASGFDFKAVERFVFEDYHDKGTHFRC